MVLADIARLSEGKLDLLGGGWNLTGPQPTPSAMGIFIEVPWAQMGDNHSFELALFTADGEIVTGPDGEPVRVEGNFAAEKPPGVLLGTPAVVNVPINFGPLPLVAGKRYRWQLLIDGQTHPDWETTFNTRPAQQALAS